jgi:hypothetical protein
VQWVLEKSSVQLVVHGEDVRPDNPTEPDLNHELSDDIISIITFFTARHNGQRSARNRKRRRDDAFPIEEAEKEEGEKDEDEGEEKEEEGPAPKRPRIVVRASEGKEEKEGAH